MTAAQVIQILLIIDQLTATVAGMAKNIENMSEADEATLQALLTEQRARTDAKFDEVAAVLSARAAGLQR